MKIQQRKTLEKLFSVTVFSHAHAHRITKWKKMGPWIITCAFLLHHILRTGNLEKQKHFNRFVGHLFIYLFAAKILVKNMIIFLG